MKLAFFDDFKLGVIAGSSVIDVTDIAKDIARLGPQDIHNYTISLIVCVRKNSNTARTISPPRARYCNTQSSR